MDRSRPPSWCTGPTNEVVLLSSRGAASIRVAHARGSLPPRRNIPIRLPTLTLSHPKAEQLCTLSRECKLQMHRLPSDGGEVRSACPADRLSNRVLRDRRRTGFGLWSEVASGSPAHNVPEPARIVYSFQLSRSPDGANLRRVRAVFIMILACGSDGVAPVA